MSFDPDIAAAALHAARVAGVPAGPLPVAIAPRDLAEAARTQHALAARLGALPPGGFKIGGTAPAMRAYLGVDEPMAGFMAAGDLHLSGATLTWERLRGPGVECELGVRLARDLPPGAYRRDDAAAAVGALFAAIEVVENRYGPPPAGDLKAIGVPTLVADQVFHRAAVLGADADWRAADLVAIAGRIAIDGVVRAEGRGGDLLGDPMAALAWLAGSDVAAQFGGLRAGQVVMLGSVTPPIWLDGPALVEVSFAPFPAVTLRLV